MAFLRELVRRETQTGVTDSISYNDDNEVKLFGILCESYKDNVGLPVNKSENWLQNQQGFGIK